MRESRSTFSSPSALLLAASMCIGIGVEISNGHYSVPALVAIVAAMVLVTTHWIRRARRPTEIDPPTDSRALMLLVAGGVIAMLWIAMNDERLVLYAVRPWRVTMVALCVMGIAVASYVPAILRGTAENQALRHARFAVVLACVLAGGIDTIRASPVPAVDVWVVEMDGADALMHGKNPFAVVSVPSTAPNHAGPNSPYVYTPLQLFVTTPAKAIAGDIRYAMLAAILIAGCAMRFAARRASGVEASFAEDAPALCYFATPKLFFILEQAWTEPVSVMFVSLVVAAHVAKRPIATSILLGLAFATKQTMIWMVPIACTALSLAPVHIAIAFGVAAATVVPFAVADFHALKFAQLDYLKLLPPRDDGLTLRTAFLDMLGIEIPG
ncbi:MAG: hypothetical protein ACRELY_13260, partial [Polyangiaceae bacterium]